MTKKEIADYLRYLAQNDYMIDEHYLSTGIALCEIAEQLEGKMEGTQEEGK